LYDPAFNLDLGMRYLGKLAGRWTSSAGAVPLTAASYNAGAGAVDRWLSERGSWDLDLFIEAIPYDETRNYTQSVVGRWFAYRFLYGDGDPADRIPFLPKSIPARAG
jgi:soluble lytic murein transglycosylase